MEFRKMIMITLYARQQKRHRCIEQNFDSVGEGGGGWFGIKWKNLQFTYVLNIYCICCISLCYTLCRFPCYRLVAKSYLTLCNLMGCFMPGSFLCSLMSPRVCSNSWLLSWWCHPNFSLSVALFSFCPQSFPALGSFPRSQLFVSGGQSIGASASPFS